jgi:phosphate:Na+ symporter
MALHAARKELCRMLAEVNTMLNSVISLITHPGKKKKKTATNISQSEDMLDYLEREIVSFLSSITTVETSLRQSSEIADYIGVASDIERMGDHCESLHHLLSRRYDKKIDMTHAAQKELLKIADRVSEFIVLLQDKLNDPAKRITRQATACESAINKMRGKMRKGHIKRLSQQKHSVAGGLIYIDMLTHFERMGDHAYNIASALGPE